MAYTKNNWQTGDTITAEKLNNMESGIVNADSPLNTDKLHIVPISIDAQTGAVSSSHRFDYDSELALFQGAETLALEYEHNRIFARLVSCGMFFLFEAELADYTNDAVKKLYISIPPVGGPDAPSVAPVFVWADEPFIVTLTPTSQDFSGTMDKTVAEINAAYEAGRKIVFRVYSSATQYNDVEVAVVYKNGSHVYPSFNAYLIVHAGTVGFDGIIFAHTGTSNDGTKNTYGTDIYPLTPMS